MLTWLIETLSRIRAFFHARDLDSDFDAELQSHLDMLAAENSRGGMDPQSARLAARRALGPLEQTREAHRQARGLPFLDSFFQDLTYAARSLRKNPAFAATAIITLGIGIGANTAIFSAIDEALFRPLSFPHSEQLADIFAFNKATQTYLSSSYPDYEDIRNRSRTFQQIAAFVRMPLNVKLKGEPVQRLPLEAVTGNFFSMLELPPAAGRVFTDSDDTAGVRVALISEEIAGPGSLGSTIAIEEQPFTVVGIVPKRYHGANLNWGDPPRVWIPLRATEIVEPRFHEINIFHQRGAQWLLITGRLKPGAAVAQAQAEIQTIAAGIVQSDPKANRDISAMVFSAARSKFWPSYRTSITRSLTVFAVAAGLVLLLTCANLSSLLLSRAVGRQREFAVRLSMGAGRTRLVRQLVTESLLLAVPGCLAALVIAAALGKLLAGFPHALDLPLALDGGIESRVLVFCMALSVVTTLLFGIVPALQSTRPGTIAALKASSHTVSGGGQDRLRNFLLVMQIAFTMILLVGGALFGRSVITALSADLGFQAQGLLTASFPIPATGTDSLARFRSDEDELAQRLRATAGIESVTTAMNPPLSPVRAATAIEGGMNVQRQEIGPGFFHTVGASLVSGREFDPRNDADAPGEVIVNQTLARLRWPGSNPVGQRLEVRKQTMQVIGVVQDFRYASLWEDHQPCIYVDSAQSTVLRSTLIVRTRGNPGNYASVVTRQWNEIRPNSPLYDLKTASELLRVALAPQRMAAWIFGAFGIMAVILASVGLYSSVAHAIARRTREIGIRLALGAKPQTLIRQILIKSMGIAGAGILIGTLISASLARFIALQAKGVSVYDGALFATVGALLGSIALCASAIPARRAACIDPQTALRSE